VTRVRRVEGYQCPVCEEVHEDEPLAQQEYVFACGDDAKLPEPPDKVVRYVCGDCQTPYEERDAAVECCAA
jgi:hypothetical protein